MPNRKKMGFVVGCFVAVVLLIPYCFAILLQKKQCEHDAHHLRCVKFISNYDGDTAQFTVRGMHPVFGKSILVRQANLITPQMKSERNCERDMALKAKNLVAKMLSQAKRIDLQNVKRSKYFGLIADIRADGTSVGGALVSQGLGIIPSRESGNHPTWCTGTGQVASLQNTKSYQ